MTEQHPITPPPELMQQWVNEASGDRRVLITLAARWGADQELEACCEWLDIPNNRSDRGDGWLMPRRLRAARRPKPPSLAEQALQALGHLDKGAESQMDTSEAVDCLRRALERLQELEGENE